MKTFYRLLVACLLLVTPDAFAQTYSYTGGTSTNVFPLNSATNNRCQFLFTPSDLGNPPAGNITKLYFMSASAVNGTGVFTDLTVRIGTTTATSLVTGPFITGVTTVYMATSTNIPLLAASDWFEIVLQTPFFYPGGTNLIIDLSQTGYTAGGLSTKQNTTVGTGGGYRLYGPVSGTTGTAGVATANIGFDYGAGPGLGCVMTPTAPANAGFVCLGPATTTLSWPAVTAATGYDVYLNTGTTATTVVSTNQPGTTFTTSVAAGSYAWKIVPKNATGPSSNCPTFTFTATPNVTPTATITSSATGPVCAGRSVTYTATSTNAGTTPTYQWKKRTVDVGISSNIYTDNNPIPGDTISVVVTSSAPCASPASVTSNVIIPNILPSPTASVGPLGNVSFCTGSSVPLISSTDIGFSYQWQLSNVNIAGAISSTYNVSTAGAYRVIITSGSCKDTSLSKAVTVDIPPVSTITSAGTSFCQGEALTLTGPAAGTGLSYQWLLNGTPISGATLSTYAANTAGSYRLKLSRGSCKDTSAVKIITVNQLPVATATAASATGFCTGGSVVLNANTGAGFTYQWQLNNVAIPGATSAAYTATVAGSYSVSVSNGTCSSTSNAIPVAVSTLATPAISATGATAFCLGDSVALQSTTGTGYTYQWLLNNNTITGATTSTLQAFAAGNYSVAVSNGICTTTSTGLTVSITPTPSAVITPTGSASICFRSGVIMTANTGSGYTYLWSFNGNFINGATRDIFTAYLPGNYSVSIFNGTCPAISAPVVVTVNPLPIPVIAISGIYDMSTDIFVTYQWYLNGVLIPGATSQNYRATTVGDYYVIVTDALGCSGTSAVQSVTVVGVNKIAANAAGIKLYPNPVENILNVEASRAVNITITSIDGKKLIAADNAKSVDLGQLAQGLYLIRISDAVTGALIHVDKVNKK